jgi:anti-sigma factor RsiW
MKNDCTKYREQLVEAALNGSAAGDAGKHLQSCPDCAKELAALRERRDRLDTLLPLLARGAEPSAGFRARVLAAAEKTSERNRLGPRRAWVFAGLAAVVVAALTIGWILEQRQSRLAAEDEIAAAQKLAEWRAPSDVLLETPENELLRTTPKLGQSYLKTGGKKNQEE